MTEIQIDLDHFVATEYPKVVGAVGLITGNRQDADDAVQDALLSYLARPPAKPISNIAA
jgi:RNA polymerase sigma factor (sigma-70 family)